MNDDRRSQSSLRQDHLVVFNILRNIATAVADMFGEGCETVVHDLHDPASSIVHIENGHVTGRKVGDGIRDLAAILRSERFHDDMLTDYITKTKEGKVLKSSTLVVRDENGDVIAAFAVNYDLGKFYAVKNVIDSFVTGHELDPPESEKLIEDSGVLSILRHIIRQSIDEVGIPVSEMTKSDKVKVVAFLDEREVFLVRGAIDYVAQTLSVSRFTIYNYLDEVRAAQIAADDSARTPPADEGLTRK
ncbi:helix-turn-helix transcriptional regulator [Actinoallomurus vinaceus]|uniref:Helix-turn-helix transcriptional regulator n=1 Tax=Actinoallomurus vinaceus TaxID=1080074 RepID=A0ABP8UUY5_9ACTN